MIGVITQGYGALTPIVQGYDGVGVVPPPPPPPGYQQRGLGAIVLTDPSKLTKKKKRRVRLALRGQLLFPADVADQQTIEDDWLLFGIDLIDSELFDELGTL